MPEDKPKQPRTQNNPFYFTLPANDQMNVQVLFYPLGTQVPSEPGPQELSFSMSAPGGAGFGCNNYHPEMPTAYSPNPIPSDQSFQADRCA